MSNLEIVLLGLILFFPVIDLINEKYKSKNKNVEYIKIAFFLWIPTLLLAYLFYTQALSVSNFDYVVEYNWKNLMVGSLLLLAITYLLVLIKQIQSSEKFKSEIIEQFKPYMDLMPATKSQVLMFTMVVSVTAGICEELIFRAYLYTLFDAHIGRLGAVLLSSIIFGLMHLYLGWQGVVRTSVLGAALCGVYIFTGNIVMPILMHAFIDIYSGLLCYFAIRKST